MVIRKEDDDPDDHIRAVADYNLSLIIFFLVNSISLQDIGVYVCLRTYHVAIPVLIQSRRLSIVELDQYLDK